MNGAAMIHSGSERISDLVQRVCQPDPKSVGGTSRLIGVTEAIVQEVHQLSDEELELLVEFHTTYIAKPIDANSGWATGDLLAHAGPRVIPLLARVFHTEDHFGVRMSLLDILGRIGEPALDVLTGVFPELDDPRLVGRGVEAFFRIGEPAARQIALALEHRESATSEHILSRLRRRDDGRASTSASLVKTIAEVAIEELVARCPDRPDTFNEETVAALLRTLMDRNPQLRRKTLGRLCELAFGDDEETSVRAVQVAAKLDLDDFLQLVRGDASERPEAAARVLYRLGRSESLPSQKRSLQEYTGRLDSLEKRSLQRWDAMAKQGKYSFWLGYVMTLTFFVVGLVVIGVGIWLVGTASNTIQQAIGGGMSAVTAIGGMLTRFWSLPVKEIRRSSVQTAALEAAFIAFMTRTGQIRLLFEQHHARGDMDTQTLATYQQMMADVQQQTARALGAIQQAIPESESVLAQSEPSQQP